MRVACTQWCKFLDNHDDIEEDLSNVPPYAANSVAEQNVNLLFP
jgi:hypothetical protein